MDQTAEGDFVSKRLRRLADLQGRRSLFDEYWLEIGRRVLPRQNIFFRTQSIIWQGERRDEFIFDSTASLANGRYSAAVESMVSPRTQMWHGIAPMDASLKDNRRVKLYCQQVRDILFDCRYAPKANFAAQTGEFYTSIGAFGTSGLFIDDDIGVSLRYQCANLSELYLAQDFQGNINTVYRDYWMTAEQAVKEFGKDAGLPEQIVNAAKERPDQEFEFLHIVEPNQDFQYGRGDYTGMKWASTYISVTGRKLIEQGGYRVFPWSFGRHVTAPREVYGRSPAMDALPDSKTLQEMWKTIHQQGQRSVAPPLLTYADDMEAFDLRGGAMNYGTMTSDGKPLVMGFQSGSNFEVGMELMDDVRKRINDNFYVTLFQILAEEPTDMTATEVLERAQEKGALLAPTMGRLQSDFGGSCIAREIDILAHAGQLPPMPPELQERGGAIKIEYTSPLNRFMRSGEAAGFLRTMEALTPLSTANPRVLQIFDAEKVARGLSDINGVPEDWLLSPEDMAAQDQANQQAANIQQLVAAAPGVAGAVKDLTDAQATAGNQPGVQPGQAPA